MSDVAIHLRSIRNRGYSLVNGLLSREETALLKDRVLALSDDGAPSTIMEDDGITPRGLHGLHINEPLFIRLTRLRRILAIVTAHLESAVYTYQFKVNMKVAHRGAAWPWHQDFIFWREEDNLPSDLALTASVFLDDVTEYNGPMYLIPGSDQAGCVSEPVSPGSDWRDSFTSSLKYHVRDSTVERHARSGGIVSATGSAGSVLFFVPNMIHCSPANMSPFGRSQIFITYNSVANAPDSKKLTRPPFIVSRDTSPLIPLESLTDDRM